jgi:hypothetical protein
MDKFSRSPMDSLFQLLTFTTEKLCLFTPILEEVDRMQGILVSTIQKLKS